MFTSQARIDRKTGPDNLGRFEYLQALVTEFQDTDRQGNVSRVQLKSNVIDKIYMPLLNKNAC